MHKEEDTSPGSTYDTFSDYASSTISYLTIEMGYESIQVIIDDLPSLYKHIQQRIKRQLQWPSWY